MADPSGTARADEIATDLRRQILGGKYEAGERLPSERDLAAKWGAHRSSVREALKQLEQLGLIAIRRGGGARVLPIEEAGLGLLPHLLAEHAPPREIVAQWLDVWELVVAGSARLAVERASAEEFARALELLRRLRSRSLTPAEFIETGDALTSLVASASRNVVLRMVRNGLTAQLHQKSETRLRVVPARKAWAPLVRQLEEAVERRDPAAVEECVRAMIRQNRQVVIGLYSGGAGAN